MRRALTLARKGEGSVSPNPLVGAVIVREGRIIGEGWHRCYGENHAEINADSGTRRKPSRGRPSCHAGAVLPSRPTPRARRP
jgi:diaminohydroxyphosphoribosylaminopyrimidine deaminase/5-amino-6-(5-phosphoribosylamino)uracil reductase